MMIFDRIMKYNEAGWMNFERLLFFKKNYMVSFLELETINHEL